MQIAKPGNHSEAACEKCQRRFRNPDGNRADQYREVLALYRTIVALAVKGREMVITVMLGFVTAAMSVAALIHYRHRASSQDRRHGAKRSIGQLARVARITDNDADFVTPEDILSELWGDNKALVFYLKNVHSLCDDAGDVASASVIENWIEEAQRRAWFL